MSGRSPIRALWADEVDGHDVEVDDEVYEFCVEQGWKWVVVDSDGLIAGDGFPNRRDLATKAAARSTGLLYHVGLERVEVVHENFDIVPYDGRVFDTWSSGPQWSANGFCMFSVCGHQQAVWMLRTTTGKSTRTWVALCQRHAERMVGADRLRGWDSSHLVPDPVAGLEA